MSENNGFKLTMAEFKGKVLQSLNDITEDIKDIKKDNKEHKVSNTRQHEHIFKKIRQIESRPSFSINPVKWAIALFGLNR